VKTAILLALLSVSVAPFVQAQATAADRIAYARSVQESLWRKSVECTIEARGTTFYFEYVLAGKAFEFQFQEDVLSPNWSRLRALGFRNVTLTNGYDHSWTWDLRSDQEIAADRNARARAEKRAKEQADRAEAQRLADAPRVKKAADAAAAAADAAKEKLCKPYAGKPAYAVPVGCPVVEVPMVCSLSDEAFMSCVPQAF
jgi:hypothetical protein